MVAREPGGEDPETHLRRRDERHRRVPGNTSLEEEEEEEQVPVAETGCGGGAEMQPHSEFRPGGAAGSDIGAPKQGGTETSRGWSRSIGSRERKYFEESRAAAGLPARGKVIGEGKAASAQIQVPKRR